MAKLTGQTSNRSGEHNYLIGGNVCNAFAVGAIGWDDDFFIIGAPPRAESNYPLISGNFPDADGNVLFKLEQNTLVANQGNCSKILSDRIGYEIRDSAGSVVLKVSARLEPATNGQTGENWLTGVEGNFYDKNKNLIIESGGENGFIETSVGCLLGFDGESFATNEGPTAEYIHLAGISILNHGRIFQPLYGLHENETIHLDGKAIMPGAMIQNCDVIVKNGKFALLGGDIIGNKLSLEDEAMRIAVIMGIRPNSPPPEE